MIISPKYKFIFLSTMKTGGTSLNQALIKIDDPDKKVYDLDENDPMLPKNYDRKFYKHSSCFDLQEDKYKNYLKFAFVRNPWDRVLSWFFFYSRFNVMKNLSTKDETFNDFILNKSKSYRWGGDNQSQHNFTKCCDFIGRYENLQEDFNIICDKIKIPRQELPHFNKTKHKHYTEYYDDETREIVAEKYAKDIEYFGYKFGK